ncbi:MAG: hypothetical protein Q7U02_07620, partial [Desulfosalsimonadaceae bacterium]|nr:hypothetical protein [Desulfosalsimonadaceae bacterium]
MKNRIPILFHEYSIIDRVENNLIDDLSNPSIYHSHVEFDLSQTKYIDAASLIYLISVINRRDQDKEVTTIRLPAEKSVRDFLRSWSFPKGIRETIGTPFKSIVSELDHRFFGENTTVKDQRYSGNVVQTKEGDWVSLLENYLPIITFNHKNGSFSPSVALSEAKRWKGKVIESVLEKHLLGP